MNEVSEKKERRTSERLQVHKGIFAFLGGGQTVLGEVINIGKGGLCVRYAGNNERTSAKSRLQVLTAEGDFTSDKFPIKTVWDSTIPLRFSFATLPIRRCGIRFGDLTPGQRADLNQLIGKHTGLVDKIK